MQTVTNAVVQEVVNNTGLSWFDAVSWCDKNLPSGWRNRNPSKAKIIEIEEQEDEPDA